MTPVPWIRLYVSFFDHPKTRKLRRALGTVEPIQRLWAWAAECCQDGDLSDQSVDDIEESAGWRGERGKAFAAMVEAGFIDGREGECSLHGWGEKTGAGVEHLIAARASTAERQRRYRFKQEQALRNGLRDEYAETVGKDRIGEDRREEKKEIIPPTPPTPPKGGRSRRATPSPGFQSFWNAYPRKVAKGAAERAWPGDELLPAIIAALEWQTKNWTDPQYVPHPGTWLRAKRWEDERPSSPPQPELKWAKPVVD